MARSRRDTKCKFLRSRKKNKKTLSEKKNYDFSKIEFLDKKTDPKMDPFFYPIRSDPPSKFQIPSDPNP